MQLFILDRDPGAAAAMLADIHIRKMCLETAQILSSVLLNLGKIPETSMPKPYNPRHRVILAVNTPGKINWVLAHNTALHREFARRFGKTHRCSALSYAYERLLFCGTIPPPENDFSFARSFKDVIIPEPDIIKAFRIYYLCKSMLIKNWHYTKTAHPAWMQDEQLILSAKNALGII